MTDEEINRKFDIVADHLANLAVSNEQAVERVARLEEAQEITTRQIGLLSNALIELTEAHTRTQGALTQLAEAQVHSDHRLDALIDIVQGERGGAK
jgi:hypothetical protein